MVTIKLFCASGMSTSIVVEKIKDAAKKRNLEVDVSAYPEAKMGEHLKSMDVALLGPQVGYTLTKAKKLCDPVSIPVGVIPMVDYGMMNGEKILDFALKLIKK